MLRTSPRFSATFAAFLVVVIFADSVAADEREQAAQPVLLAHYMPWYAAKPFSERWGWHWTMNHFNPDRKRDGRLEVASRYYPAIGPYDSGDPQVLEYHLLLMRLAGIDGVIVDWYGRSNFRDYAMLHRNTTRLLQQCERLKMKFAICYEDQTITALAAANRIAKNDRVAYAVDEIQWLSKYWFKSPSYLKLDGKPVLLSFGHDGLTSEEWGRCLSQLSLPVAYFSQDVLRPGATGGFGWPSPTRGIQHVDRFLTDSARWPHRLPAAFPRFDDIYQEANVSAGYPMIPDNHGETFKVTFGKALRANARIIQIATWNDWGEGTQIEPSVEFGNRDLQWLQESRFGRRASEARPRSSDFQIPRQILAARRAKAQPKSMLDALANSIANSKWQQARRMSKQLASP